MDDISSETCFELKNIIKFSFPGIVLKDPQENLETLTVWSRNIPHATCVWILADTSSQGGVIICSKKGKIVPIMATVPT